MDKKIETEILQLYHQERYKFELFLNGVYDFFHLTPCFNEGDLPLIHSLRSRLKDPIHLAEKLNRKDSLDSPITTDNVFDKITDLAGIRVLHLYRSQFRNIHNEIMKRISDRDWFLYEPPCAYTWDPEIDSFYTNLGISVQVRETFYTSVHYVIMPKEHSPIKCEIQVRTLYEEIWGEIDHYLNYPSKTTSISCGEQLRVLSKLSVTGTRLVDSILNSYQEHVDIQNTIAELNNKVSPTLLTDV